MDIVSEIKCPECGGVIEYDDTYDNYSDDYCFVSYRIGHCIKCNAQFQWEEDFKIKF